MAYIKARVNKETLKYIRVQRQISFDYIYRTTKCSQDKIELWENSDEDEWPTINQAKLLAKCYHVPFAGFYMNREDINKKNIPDIRNMRQLLHPVNDESAVNLAILDLLYDRDFYTETKKEFKERIPKFDLYITGNSVNSWAREIRSYLRLKIEKQYKIPSPRQLYLLIRDKIESKGIFVQCFKGVDLEIMRGLAIYDQEGIPIIGINDNDRSPAKLFTMLHELVHIIKRSASMCNEMYNSFTTAPEEVFCNAVAGEVLVPSDIIRTEFDGYDDSYFGLDKVDQLAKRFAVSSEVVARRLLDCKICPNSWYIVISKQLSDRYIHSKEASKLQRKLSGKNGIPRNMPREAVDRTSTDMCRVLVRGYSEGFFDRTDLSSHIGIKEKHIDTFVAEVLKWYH